MSDSIPTFVYLNVILPAVNKPVLMFSSEVWAKIIGVDVIVLVFRVTINGLVTVRIRNVINISRVFMYYITIDIKLPNKLEHVYISIITNHYRFSRLIILL